MALELSVLMKQAVINVALQLVNYKNQVSNNVVENNSVLSEIEK